MWAFAMKRQFMHAVMHEIEEFINAKTFIQAFKTPQVYYRQENA